ncbi:nickel import ATP-binding protein NikD, putative [Synechococcus sp. PCC 7335]|uniref:ABC transporter ATP-binding protein n=1 Tax=Synechococcus sp. (strain ATCC 29403 / PCC 7335) TaxID=91464 RepID=UPI00017ED987|nr:ABC transporter ATP-binding protein [Synechococcus sp. PCC 7335]EDX87081.1 nickel import ATP-binding protein NikD, putative [Synechococcus sp. PCC 7335]
MSDTILDVQGLTVEFATAEEQGSDSLRAVDNVSFRLARGQTIGIVGESGSGKSVTSLAVMGLVPTPPGRVTNGQVLFKPSNGSVVDLQQVSKRQMRHYRGCQIAMIFQEPMSSLNPVYTCGFQLVEAIRQHQRISKQAAYEQAIAQLIEVRLLPPEMQMFEQVRLELNSEDSAVVSREVKRRQRAMLDRFPHQLSGGQIQRLMIAMALSSNPSLLIADEPTTALDVTVQSTILDLLRELRDRRGMSMIFITHDLGIIAEIADQVAVMYQGKIVETGAVLDIFKSPQHPYTQGLLACRPRPDQRLRQLPTVSDYMEEVVSPEGDRIIQAKSQDNYGTGLPPIREISPREMQIRLNDLEEKGPLITVENLKVGYPVQGVFGRIERYVMAVNEVSFEVYQGETFGLVGESGCGKTTLGRALLQLVKPMGGKVWFEGRELTQLRGGQMRKRRREMQVIFQDPYSSLNPRMSIGNAIAEPLKIHGVIRRRKNLKERVEYLLERVGLDPHCLNRFPHEFSGGQRQRVCIARALALSPKFIVCDESVSALDVSVQAQVLNLLKELQAEFKLTYIFISHDLGVVKFMSDRIMVMNQGRIEEIGPAEEIYQRPRRDYTRQLISAIPEGTLKRIQDLQTERERQKALL